MNRILDRGKAGVGPSLAAAQHLPAPSPIPRGIPGAGQGRPHPPGVGCERQRLLEEGYRFARLPTRELNRTEPKERQRRPGIELQGVAICLLGSGAVAEFLVQLAHENEARRVAGVFLDPRGENFRRPPRVASAIGVGEQVARREAGDIPRWKEFQRLAIALHGFPHQAVGMEGFPVFEPGAGVFRLCADPFRKSVKQRTDLRLHSPDVHHRGTEALPGGRERQEPEPEREPERKAKARKGCDHAAIVLPCGMRRQLFWD